MNENEKKAYRPRLFKRKIRKKVSPLQRLKNKLKYRKNKTKIRQYNKRWRMKNKAQIKRRQKLRRILKSK